ncbi:MAG: DUF5591 domain-containing protein [Thermoplasmatales archaeon]
MRYLARRFGHYYGFDIPAVISPGDMRIGKQDISSRREIAYSKGNVITLNRVNRLNSRDIVDTVMKVRVSNPESLIYLPALGLPYDYPALFYIGVDILDDSRITLLGDSRCISEFGVYESEGCKRKNMAEKDRIMDLVKISLENGRFRELVENYSITSFSKEILRIADMDYYNIMDKFMDLRERKIYANSVESIRRPEVVNFRERVKTLGQTAENLLLIPCSAVKPYSRSKTHRILHSLIKEFLPGIQEVIVTSPLGLVPREIEFLFPAAYYDIPVTGHWYGEEREILLNIGKDFFSGKKYRNVFFILPRGESEIKNILGEAEGIEGNLNLENAEKLREILEERGIKGNGKEKQRRGISNIVKFLYSVQLDHVEIETRDEGNRKIVNYRGEKFAKITDNGVKMMPGLAEFLKSRGLRVVDVEGVFRGDNVFIPGIKSMSEDVRPGMDVVLVSEGSVVGRGISEIASLDLKVEKKGLGIRDVSYF